MKKRDLDSTDNALVAMLDIDGRMSVKDLAQSVGLSAPSVAERVRQLESRGLIRSYTIDVSLPELGFPLEAIVRIKPLPGALHIVEKMIVEQPRFTSCDKVTGDDCFIARLVLRTISELDDLLDPLHEKAETNTAIIKTSPIRNRLPPLA